MYISWVLDLSNEDKDIRNKENVVMGIIHDFRANKDRQPSCIRIVDSGIGNEVRERLVAAGLPAQLAY